MKRYEKMSKEEIIELYTRFDCGDCNACPYFEEKGRRTCADDGNCSEAIKIWLNEEIEMIPRAWTFKTVEEAASARNTLKSNHCEKIKCHNCKYLSANSNGYSCAFQWLYELVEKPAEEKA